MLFRSNVASPESEKPATPEQSAQNPTVTQEPEGGFSIKTFAWILVLLLIGIGVAFIFMQMVNARRARRRAEERRLRQAQRRRHYQNEDGRE